MSNVETRPHLFIFRQIYFKGLKAIINKEGVMKNIDYHEFLPRNIYVFFYNVFFNFYRKIPLKYRKYFENILYNLSLNNEINFSPLIDKEQYKKAFWNGALITFFFCFVVISVWTAIEGTLYGTDINKIYFINDYANLVNYIILCPLYIGLNSMLICLTLKGWINLKKIPEKFFSRNAKKPILPFSILTVIVLSLSTVFTINYIYECQNPSTYQKIYWFIEAINKNGERIFSALGIYYILLTFILFNISILAIMFFLPIFLFSIEIGKSIKKIKGNEVININLLKENLSYFKIVAKGLIVIYMLNLITWKWQNPEGSINFLIMAVLLTFFGIFFVSIPRYYIEFELIKYKIRKYNFSKDESVLNYEHLMKYNDSMFVYILDAIILTILISYILV